MTETPNGGPSEGSSQSQREISWPSRIALKARDKLVAYREKGKDPEYRKERRERLTILLLAITAGLLLWQLFEMIEVYKPIRDQAIASGKQAAAAEKAAEATVRAADAATKQSEIATQQAVSSDRAAAQAQRAWVGPRNAKSEKMPAIGEDVPVTLEYLNSGREPAREFIYDLDSFVVTSEEDQAGVGATRINAFIDKCKMLWKPLEIQVVYPTTGGLGGGYSLFHTVDKSKIDDGVVAGEKSIIFTGCFVYKTTEQIRRSSFCFYFNAKKTKPATWNFCNTGNDAD